jgi:hypothetical protein
MPSSKTRNDWVKMSRTTFLFLFMTFFFEVINFVYLISASALCDILKTKKVAFDKVHNEN